MTPAKKTETLAEELIFMLQEIPARRVWFDTPSKNVGDERWRLRLHGIVEEIATLESELAQRRVKDAEIAKRLRVWYYRRNNELWEPMFREIITDLEATLTPAGAGKA